MGSSGLSVMGEKRESCVKMTKCEKEREGGGGGDGIRMCTNNYFAVQLFVWILSVCVCMRNQMHVSVWIIIDCICMYGCNTILNLNISCTNPPPPTFPPWVRYSFLEDLSCRGLHPPAYTFAYIRYFNLLCRMSYLQCVQTFEILDLLI